MYDVIVVGARCAGAPAAMLLGRKGYRVLLVDRSTFPSDIPHGHFIHRHGPGRDDVGQHLAGTDRRKLVDVADDQESGPLRHCLHERLHQHDVDHGGFVNYQQITVERVVVAAFKASTFGIHLQ